jgi:hypothetical protein
MDKKWVYLILVVFALRPVHNTSAADITWDGGGADSLWSTPANWSGDQLPTASDDAIIEMDPGATIDATVTADALSVSIADTEDSVGRVTMTGGTLTVHQTGGGGPGLWIGNTGTGYFDMSGGTIIAEHVYLPRNPSGRGYMTMSDGTITTGQSVTLGLHHNEYGELIMTGGTVNVGSMFRCSDYGNALLRITGGSINVAGTFYIVRRGNSGGSNTAGRVQLDGGTITVEDFQMDPDNSGRPATMDIAGGTLIISGDKTGRINQYIINGWITAYGGGGELNVELVGGDTVVTASLTGRAWNPSPRDGAVDVPVDTKLNWSPGIYGVQHDVYFGTNFNDVNAASDPDVLPGQGRQDPNTYDPGGLDLDTTYYWRIDEVNEAETPTTWRGYVWSFTTPEYFVIDDFEDYNDWPPDRVFDTWPGGYTADDPANGSTVGYLEAPFTEQTIAHGGQQSMPFAYDNTGEAAYSEAERTFDTPQDWTKAGVRALSLWFYGNLNNVGDRMYVALEDSTGTRKEVPYDDPNALVLHMWQEWNIDLADLADAGVDLTSITKMYIGVGNKGGLSSGASGDLYFDDIRLYPRRCVPEYAPAGDLDGDCDVDYQDLDIMLQNWLESFVWDATGGYDGGGCLQLDGAGDRIFVPGAPFPRSAFTYALWFNPDTAMGADTDRMDFIYWTPGGQDPGARPCLVHNIDGSGRFRASIMLDTMASGDQGLLFTDSRSFDPSTWYHIAFTFDGSNTSVYVDGNVEHTLKFSGTHTKRFNPGVYFGAHSGGGNAFNGKLDDIRIYDYAVSAAGIANLSNATGEPAPGPAAWYKLDETSSGTVTDSSGNSYDGVVLFIQPYGNPYDDNIVDLKDYTVAAESWLDMQLWPAP